jgi:hypothetical protein
MPYDALSTNFSVKARIPAVLRNTNSIAAQNTFSTQSSNSTQASTGTSGQILFGQFMFELTGTWAGTISVQRSQDGGTTWQTVTTGTGAATPIAFTTNGQYIGVDTARDVLYRWGFQTGNYTSGTAIGFFEQ